MQFFFISVQTSRWKCQDSNRKWKQRIRNEITKKERDDDDVISVILVVKKISFNLDYDLLQYPAGAVVKTRSWGCHWRHNHSKLRRISTVLTSFNVQSPSTDSFCRYTDHVIHHDTSLRHLCHSSLVEPVRIDGCDHPALSQSNPAMSLFETSAEVCFSS